MGPLGEIWLGLIQEDGIYFEQFRFKMAPLWILQVFQQPKCEDYDRRQINSRKSICPFILDGRSISKVKKRKRRERKIGKGRKKKRKRGKGGRRTRFISRGKKKKSEEEEEDGDENEVAPGGSSARSLSPSLGHFSPFNPQISFLFFVKLKPVNFYFYLCFSATYKSRIDLCFVWANTQYTAVF